MSKATLYCLSVWNVVKDHRALSVTQLRCFPKASAKVELFSELTNKTQVFFENNRK